MEVESYAPHNNNFLLKIPYPWIPFVDTEFCKVGYIWICDVR